MYSVDFYSLRYFRHSSDFLLIFVNIQITHKKAQNIFHIYKIVVERKVFILIVLYYFFDETHFYLYVMSSEIFTQPLLSFFSMWCFSPPWYSNWIHSIPKYSPNFFIWYRRRMENLAPAKHQKFLYVTYMFLCCYMKNDKNFKEGSIFSQPVRHLPCTA